MKCFCEQQETYKLKVEGDQVVYRGRDEVSVNGDTPYALELLSDLIEIKLVI
jgi:hypothetical protein